MLKKFLILILSTSLLFSCGKGNKKEVISEPDNEEIGKNLYAEGVQALKDGDAFYAGKKFREAEILLSKYTWASKASLMVGYSEYSRNSYSTAIMSLKNHINSYPADKNIDYAHYLIAMCYYEQILDEKKDLEPLLKAKEKFEFIMENFPDTDYGMDARFKIDLIVDQLAAKEMSIARFYMKTEKWIPALNRLKTVTEKYNVVLNFVKNY